MITCKGKKVNRDIFTSHKIIFCFTNPLHSAFIIPNLRLMPANKKIFSSRKFFH
jgi:hypothetical protein